jgi:predicted CxxxxCH...CXXCH cytochrome family protein
VALFDGKARAVVVASLVVIGYAGCGPRGAPDPAAPAQVARAAAVASPSNHDVYAAHGIACAACHPCGTRMPGGHAADWMDTASPQFHASAANENLAGCQACHGAALDGVGGTVAVSCAQCHGASWSTTCTMCHGGTDSQTGAPPRTVWGRSAETVRVGAHTAHLAGPHGLGVVACSACHAVPADARDPGHANGATADVAFSGLATRNTTTPPAWDRGAGTCANTYCHGATLAGGALKTPSWTQTDGAARACGACHGAPPPAPHSTSADCGSCHPGYTATTVNASLHLNGAVDATSAHAAGWAAKAAHGYSVNRSGLAGCKTCHGAALDGVGGTGPSCATCHAAAGFAGWETRCTFCHGDRTAGVASPPVDTQGLSSVARVSVGAHAAHVGTALMTVMSCAQCHPDRTGSNVVTDAAHVDGDGFAEIALGTLARTGGAAATYTRTSATAASCAATYCHGAFTGGTSATMSWTATGALGCTACHGAPPPAPHSASTSCGSCHAGYGPASVNRATHLNGVVDVVPMTCTSCHGQSAQTATAASPLYAAPPRDTAGASTGLRVGAHQKHLTGGTYSNGLACVTCHSSVGSYTTAHPDQITQVGFTGAANANLRKGTWRAGTGTTAGTCGATWCHGAVIGRSGGTSGGTATAPAWTGAITACTACHAVSTSALPNRHSTHGSVACSACHGAGYSATAVVKATHVDGVKNIVTVSTGTGIRTWNSSTGSCLPSCHSTKTW